MALATDVQTVFDDPIRKLFHWSLREFTSNYRGTPLLWTPWDPGEVSCIPVYCGHFGDLVKCPVWRGVLILGLNIYRGVLTHGYSLKGVSYSFFRADWIRYGKKGC